MNEKYMMKAEKEHEHGMVMNVHGLSRRQRGQAAAASRQALLSSGRRITRWRVTAGRLLLLAL